MPTVEESTHISRPPQVVFSFLSKSENIPVWDSSVVHAETVGDGPVGLDMGMAGHDVGSRANWPERS